MHSAHIQSFLKLVPSLVEGDIDLRRLTMTSTPSLKSGSASSFSGKNIIVTGADGNLWFTEFAASRIGRIKTSGVIRQTRSKDSIEPEGIASGPDGNIWFAEFQADAIGELILPK